MSTDPQPQPGNSSQSANTSASSQPSTPTKPTSKLPKRHRPFLVGEICGMCGVGILDYNGLLDLECPVCGYTEGPGGGCT